MYKVIIVEDDKGIAEGICDCLADRCDYIIVGSRNPIASEYKTITDEKGFLRALICC